MTTKEAKEYLRQIEKLDMLITNKMIEKQRWKDMSMKITSFSTGERVQSSGSQQKMADAIDRFIDSEREIDALIDHLVDTKREIIGVIEQLSAKEYDVLHKRYIQGMTYDEIGYSCGESKSWATTVHGRALQNVRMILEKP